MTTVETVTTAADAADLDELLWHILWKPLDLPRNIRRQFRIEGEEIELVAKQDGRIIGGLVAVWSGHAEWELRHLAVSPDARHRGVGQSLVLVLVRLGAAKGCRRIHTIARNTSVDFFRKLGFGTAAGKPPEHQAFMKHGFRFELMERIVEQCRSMQET